MAEKGRTGLPSWSNGKDPLSGGVTSMLVIPGGLPNDIIEGTEFGGSAWSKALGGNSRVRRN